MNYYNEFDPKAAAWLRELIKNNLIPDGIVDTRSITEIKPDELKPYTQCHFFAGIGGWSLALQLAGWTADRPVWTGSCPCQPFSVAGKGLGTADERHLWPVFFNLIRECRPECVFGEQVANAIGKGWLDGISADLESEGYACGAAVLGAHSVGAPHIRQRLYWVVNAGHECGRRRPEPDSQEWPETANCGGLGLPNIERCKRAHCDNIPSERVQFESPKSGGSEAVRMEHPDSSAQEPDEHCTTGGVADASSTGARRDTRTAFSTETCCGGARGEDGDHGGIVAESGGPNGRLADSQNKRSSRAGTDLHLKRVVVDGTTSRFGHTLQPRLERQSGHGDHGHEPGRIDPSEDRPAPTSGSAGHWDSFDLLPCLDGKARRVESGTFPLAHGVPGRVGLLRGYGNAIVPQAAAQFIQAAEEAR
jgi:DNA (cytosine-5)-methyltransferase 1